jgi:hypothetical protein
MRLNDLFLLALLTLRIWAICDSSPHLKKVLWTAYSVAVIGCFVSAGLTLREPITGSLSLLLRIQLVENFLIITAGYIILPERDNRCLAIYGGRPVAIPLSFLFAYDTCP